jgi:tRNA-specific 2-thiouridylase
MTGTAAGAGTDTTARARVLVAMSGGVDSSVAAALLREQGYDVVGVTMRLFDEQKGAGGRGCCGVSMAKDAARVASKLGFAHYTWDFRKEFGEMVVADFCAEYGRGRTPNPCLRCNELVKFVVLLERAQQLGADYVATGHYARIAKTGTVPRAARSGGLSAVFAGWQLCRGADERKDQSYFLYTLTQTQMARLLLPVGDLTKPQVRDIARKLDLPVAEKPESQEICFVPDDDYVRFLREHRPEYFKPGPVLDTAGGVLGQHEGIAAFTVGQRKGLGLAFGERRYVVRLDAANNAVVLGSEREVYGRVVEGSDVRWVSGSVPDSPFRVWAKVRYQGKGGEALVETLDSGRVRVTFNEPQWAPTPGQAVVFWQGEVVLGGATIESTRRE